MCSQLYSTGYLELSFNLNFLVGHFIFRGLFCFYLQNTLADEFLTCVLSLM